MTVTEANPRIIPPVPTFAPLTSRPSQKLHGSIPVDSLDNTTKKHCLWEAAGIGAAAAGVASAAAYHLPRIATFAQMSAAGQWGVLAGLGLSVGTATHAFVSQVRGGRFESAAWPATIAVGAAFLGLAAVTAPAFAGLSALGQVVVWGAVATVGGVLNTMSRKDPDLTFSATTGALGGAVAASAFVQPLTPAVIAASALLGSGLGAVHHRATESSRQRRIFS